MAQVLVQNRVSLAAPNLPDAVRQTGVMTRKQSPNFLKSKTVAETWQERPALTVTRLPSIETWIGRRFS
jgi:multidrug efflux pump